MKRRRSLSGRRSKDIGVLVVVTPIKNVKTSSIARTIRTPGRDETTEVLLQRVLAHHFKGLCGIKRAKAQTDKEQASIMTLIERSRSLSLLSRRRRNRYALPDGKEFLGKVCKSLFTQ